MTGPAHIFDKPNRYIGKPEPRADAARLLQGRGSYVDDKKLPRMAHAAFVRSPHAHAKILSIDTEGARAATGVVAVYSGEDLAKHVTPYVGTLTHLAGLRSMPQHPLAVDVARWQGEPVVMIIATSRALAEDACELVYVDYDELPVAVDSETALDTGTPIIHPELESNLAWERDVVAGDIDAAFAAPDVHVVEREFRFGRHTGVTLETRGTVCDYDPSENKLTVYYSGQAPHMMQVIFSKHLDLPEENIRVISNDVGGSFGIKIHTYGDEIATAAAAKLLKRPVKFIADRFESFLTDIHARDHIVNAKMGITQAGTIVGIDFDDLTGIGPFSMYPRTSAIECNQVLNLTGAPYVMENYRAKGRVVFQNKTLMCQYRAVGHPIAMAIADGLLEDAARKIGMDPVALREINLMADDSYPRTSATGMKLDDLSHKRALRKLTELMDYDGLRKAQAMARNQGVYRGIGFVSMVEGYQPQPNVLWYWRRAYCVSRWRNCAP
jgi:carbon-monoxide dehydrogenase large subunit